MKKEFFAIMLLAVAFSMSSCRKMCPMESCHARMQHYHEGAVYDGNPWWQKRNIEIGEKYKGQKKDNYQASKPTRFDPNVPSSGKKKKVVTVIK